jgi:kumamolisin
VENGTAYLGGGTSQATPIWAGLMALIDAYLRGHRKPLVGFANPWLYRLARGAPVPPVHDITIGGNNYFAAGPGYDAVTGLGSPQAWNLARDLAAAGA